MRLIAIISAKLITKLSRLGGGHGSALPGAVAEKLDPKLLAQLLGQLPEGLVMVTGTNGKTTTTKALVAILEGQGKRVLTNRHGSNYTRGILSALIEQTNWRGRLDYDLAILEVDEAYTRVIAKLFAPRWLVVLNVMRDQLDRYGEIDTTADKIGKAVEQVTEGAILNLHDHRVAALAKRLPAGKRAVTFDLGAELAKVLPSEDDHYQAKAATKSEAADVRLTHFEDGQATFNVGGQAHQTSLKTAGLHNAVNFSAALATATALLPDAPADQLLSHLANLAPAFGRGEIVQLGNCQLTLALVKNPAGFQSSLAAYAASDYQAMLFAINDDFADGRDVSWLWDVDFSQLPKDTLKVCTGTRGYDMAIRLQYDDRPASDTTLDLKAALGQLRGSEPRQAIIFCTYTAMLKLRKLLGKQTKVEAIWE